MLPDSTHSLWTELRGIARKLIVMAPVPARSAAAAPPGVVLQDGDAIITHIEVCDQHGVGKLLRMLFAGEPNILSIRSADYYGGRNELGAAAVRISHPNQSRNAVFSRVVAALGRSTVRRILCIPYFPDDVRTALAIKEIFGVPLCTFLMDDQNVCARGIPDSLMRELLDKSRLRLAISPEIATVYELKYGHKMYFMPPVAPASMIASELTIPPADADPRHGIVIGNIWGRRWVNLLRDTVRGSSVRLTWYCNGEFRWLPCGRKSLIKDSIQPRDPLHEPELIRALRSAWFAVVPSGTMDESDDRRFIAQLSLPSRMPYMMAVSHLPMLVLGSEETGAARFVKQFGVGAVCPYERRAFEQAANRIARPEQNLAMRKRALTVAHQFSDAGAVEWIWESLAAGKPVDSRFEDLLPEVRPDLRNLMKQAR